MFGKKDKKTDALEEGAPQDSLSVEAISIDTTQTDSLMLEMTSSTSNDSLELDMDKGIVDINSLFEEFDSDIVDTNTSETSLEDVDNIYQDVLQNMQDEITKLKSELDRNTDELYKLKAQSLSLIHI